MNEIDEREEAFWARFREREAQSLRKYGGGFTQEQLVNFKLRESLRYTEGVPGLEVLGLPQRVYNPLRRFGALTVEGLEQILKENRKPYNFGSVARRIAQERYEVYVSRSRTS